MAGYMLVEERMMQPWKADGVPRQPHRFGALDYLRELRQEMFQLPGHGIRVVGLEDVLRAGKDPPRDVANFIHATMVAKANELESRGGFVQVVFKFKLRYAADLWFEAGLQRISLGPVFGQVRPVHERGNEYYIASFNLA